MPDISPTRVVVTDANIIINLIHVDRLDLLGALSLFSFVVPPEVVAEVNVADQRAALTDAIHRGIIEECSFTGTEELELFVAHSQVIGKGESACLAMAEVHGWLLASDEKGKFKRIATDRLGANRILNTPGIFVLAIRAKIITVEDADADKKTLEGHRFKMKFNSFQDVLGAKC